MSRFDHQRMLVSLGLDGESITPELARRIQRRIRLGAEPPRSALPPVEASPCHPEPAAADGSSAPDTITTKGQPADPMRGSRGLAQKEPTPMTRPVRACFTATIGGALAARLHVRRAA